MTKKLISVCLKIMTIKYFSPFPKYTCTVYAHIISLANNNCQFVSNKNIKWLEISMKDPPRMAVA